MAIVPPPPPVDPNNYPASACIGNNCRFTAFMVQGIDFNTMYKVSWKTLIGYFKDRLMDPANGFVHPGRKNAIKIQLQLLESALGPSTTHRELLENEVDQDPNRNPIIGPSSALKAMGVFQAWFHVPNQFAPGTPVDPTKERIRTLFSPSTSADDDGFFDLFRHWTFEEILTTRTLSSLNPPNGKPYKVMQLAKELGVLRTHASKPFTLPIEDIYPGGCTGTPGCCNIESTYAAALLKASGGPTYEDKALPNGYCCSPGGGCVGPYNKYCQPIVGDGCNANSDLC